MNKVSKFFENKNNKDKIYIIIIITTIIAILLVGAYALIEWISSENTELTLRIGNVSVSGMVCSNENDITVDNMGPVFDYEESGEIVEFTVLNYTGTTAKVNAMLNLDTITDNLKNKSFKYVLLASEDEINYSILSEGNFENSNNGDTIMLLEESEIINNTYYKIIFYIDGNQVNPNNIQNGSLTGSIQFCGEGLSDFKINNITVDGESYVGFPKGNYTVNIDCNGAEATFDYETGHLKVSSISKSKEAKCTPTFTKNETTNYLDDHIASLKGTVQGNGEVVEEIVQIPDYSSAVALTETEYGSVSIYSTYNEPSTSSGTDASGTFKFEFGKWRTDFSAYTDPSRRFFHLKFNAPSNGYYQLCYTMSPGNYGNRLYLFKNTEQLLIEGSSYLMAIDSFERTGCVDMGGLAASDSITVVQRAYTTVATISFSLQKTSTINNLEEGIRYEGKNPNNYIRFNNEMWRIIGVFDTEVVDDDGNVIGTESLTKIIRNESIGGYVWHKSSSNIWPNSSLYNLLNTYYYNADNGQSSGHCYQQGSSITGHCDYTYTGIQDYYRPMVSKVKWYLGGYSSRSATASLFYGFERSTSDDNYYSSNVNYKTANGHIGLMYVSDYGYSVLSSSCARTTNLDSYNSSSCAGSSWLKKETDEWTITHDSSFSNSVFRLYYSGSLDYTSAFISNATRPVLYLNSSVYIISGDGTEANPYYIAMD